MHVLLGYSNALYVTVFGKTSLNYIIANREMLAGFNCCLGCSLPLVKAIIIMYVYTILHMYMQSLVHTNSLPSSTYTVYKYPMQHEQLLKFPLLKVDFNSRLID